MPGKRGQPVQDFTLKRIGMIMEPKAGDPYEAEGVLNPAAVRGPDGELYLFPRLVARGNYSRIGIARVRFSAAGDPCAVERLGIALEPEADYERRPDGSGGCEDARITWVEPLRRYLMTYTAETTRARDLCSVSRYRFRPRGQQGCQLFPGCRSQSRRQNAARHASSPAFRRNSSGGNRLPLDRASGRFRPRKHLDLLLPDGSEGRRAATACSIRITG